MAAVRFVRVRSGCHTNTPSTRMRQASCFSSFHFQPEELRGKYDCYDELGYNSTLCWLCCFSLQVFPNRTTVNICSDGWFTDELCDSIFTCCQYLQLYLWKLNPLIVAGLAGPWFSSNSTHGSFWPQIISVAMAPVIEAPLAYLMRFSRSCLLEFFLLMDSDMLGGLGSSWFWSWRLRCFLQLLPCSTLSLSLRLSLPTLHVVLIETPPTHPRLHTLTEVTWLSQEGM